MTDGISRPLLFGFLAVALVACSDQEKDPVRVEFERKFLRDAVLIKTCPGDARYASGPTAVTTLVYRYEQALWYEDTTGYRRVDAPPERVCDVFVTPK